MSKDRCEDCAFYDDGFDWVTLSVIREPSCQYGSPPNVCRAFYLLSASDLM